MQITAEERAGLATFVDKYGTAAVVSALAEIETERGEDAAAEWLAALALELEEKPSRRAQA